MSNKLFLFDIDGTLISPGPAGRNSISKAIENYTGVPPNLQIKDVAGMTDKLIVKNALYKCGINGEIKSVIDDIVNEYVSLLEKSYSESDGAFVYDDSIALINKVKSKRIPIGLLTGNIKRGAKIKLDKFDLMKYFPFGAFADDGNTRNDLPIVAKNLAQELYNTKFNFENIVLVGDTPEDAIAASANGCKSIIVCRRKEWYDDIKDAGADLIVESLDEETIEEIYLS